MKKISLLLLSLLCLPTFSQLQKSIVYDFNNPQNLNPSITPSVDNAGIVNVTSKTFTNDSVKISFAAGGQPVGAQIFTFIDPYSSQTTYSLRITFTTTMTVSIGGGAVLDSIRISKESTIGALHLDTGQPGVLDPYQMYKFWKSGTKTCTSVTFKCGDTPALIQQMTVYYTTPSAVLTPTETGIADNATVESFSSMSLTFGSAMQLKDGSGILLTNKSGDTQILTASCIGNVVTLKAPATINEDGDYTITVPAGCFVDSEGYENKELTYHFKVYVPRNTFNDYTIVPERGRVNSLNDTIFISYADVVKLDPEAQGVVLNKDGKPLYQLALSVSEDKKTVYLTHEHGNITESGVYTVTVPEKTIHNDFLGNEALDRYNAKIDLQWTVDSTPIDTETMKAAKALLANTDYMGLGYPASDSPSRTNLQALTEAQPMPTDEQLTAAMGAFYNETNVTMPIPDHYYKVSGINAEGKRLYLAYQNGSIVLTTNANEGAPFLLNIISNNTVTLQTRDGKYLHVLTAPSATGSEYPNVTDAYNAAINNLTLAKLKIAGVDSTLTIGLFSLSGSSINTQNLMHSQLDYKNNAISSQEGGALTYNVDNSCAFILEETEKYADVEVAEANCTLSPTQVENNGEKLTLNFPDVKVLTIENATAPYFTNKSGAKVTTSVAQLLTPISDSTLSFSVNLSGLVDGTYTLVIPEYTLFYSQDGKVMTPAEIKKEFTIKAEPKFQYAFDTYATLPDVSVKIPVTDESLNDFIVFIQVGVSGTGIVADESKTVRLALFDDNSTIRTGHFVAYSAANFAKDFKNYYPDEDVPGNVQAIKLVLDSPLKLGELKPGSYSYVIEAGTFGDANFGKYLKGDKTVKAEDCVVNRKIVLTQRVDNEAAIPKYPSAEVLAAAKELLKKSGMGYPTANSSARKALQALVDSGMGDDAEYNATMQTFIEDTSVEKPAAGKYYTIAGVTSNNKVAYLQYDGTNVTLTHDAAKATGFKTVIKNDVYTFKTGDGKYLHTLVNNNDIEGTTTANVSKDSSSVNNLLVNRLGNIIDVDGKSTMGLFSFAGKLGKDGKTGYSLVNAAAPAIEAPSATLTSFTETKTNGFRFAEIDKTKIPVPTLKYTLSPADKAELLSLKQVTVTFSYPGEVTIADKSKVTLKDAKGTAVAISGVALASGTKNKVNITFAELAPGTYMLNAAEGAFTYIFAETKKNVPAITATYTVPAKPELKYTLSPASGAKLEELSSVMLTFSSPTAATLKDASKITLMGADKKAVAVQVKAVEGKQGTFTVSFNKLTPGTYTLTAAQGAFVYTLANTELQVGAITATYTVEAAADIKWALSPVPGDYEAMNSLTLTFTSNKEIALADQSKVTLKNVLGMAVTLKDIKKDGNKFTISFDKLGTGPYTFEAAQGAFTYTFVGETMQVEAITAKYTILAPPEVAVAVYPGTGTKFESLSSVKLTFTCTKPIELADESKVKLTDADGNAVELKSIENDGNVYTIEFDELPSGNYTFSFEKGAFVYTFGDEDMPVDGIEAVSYTVVPKPQVTWALNPEPDSSLESLSSVALTLTADRTISLADKSKVTLTDEAGNAITLTDVTMERGVCTITFDEITTSGTYTLTAAQGAFTYQFGGKATPVDAITATYKVAEPRPSEPVLAEATELLKNVGLGYPTADSDARKSLSDLVESEHGTDDVFTKAMDDFYAETNVVMPAVDKYYHIVAITAANDTAYVNQEGSLTGLVTSEAEATPLKLTKSDEGGYVLTTADGQWQLNVSISKKANAEDAKSVFGLFSIDPFDKIKAIGFTFAEVDKADIPVPQIEFALTPKSGTDFEVLDSLTLTFTGYEKIDLTDGSKVYLKGDTIVKPASIELAKDSQSQYIIRFDAFDVPGSYELAIEKGAFTFDYADIVHQIDAITATYVVKEPVPSDSILAAAKELLKLSGVGYPAVGSESRVALDSLINSGKGKDEVFEAAMAAFIAETDVEQPADGKYYRVTAVNSKGAEGFVTYEKGGVGLTADAENLTVGVFRVNANVDGTLTLSTFDSQYECDVKPVRLSVESASAEETFGLFSLYGTLGAEENAYARANIKDNEWKFNTDSNLDEYLGLMLSEKMTTAFRFTEVAEEDLVIPEATLTCIPGEGSVEKLEEVILMFDVPFPVTLKDWNLISLRAQDGSEVPIVAQKTSSNACKMTLINVVAGTYTLEIADGAFTYGFFDKEIPVKATSRTFKVLVGADFTYDFNVGDMACQLDGEKEREYFMDTALSTLTVGFKDAVTVNPDKTVFVVDEDGVTMVTGHLEPAEDEENVYKLVLDTPIAEGTLTAGTYTFVFEEGMFGDDNYASYLASPYLVLMADCHVSKELKPFSVKVDNEKAQIPVGILELMNGELSNVKWYDLNGRRVVGKPQKGRVYIVNGKKVTY